MRISAQYPDEVYFDPDEKQFFASFMGWGGEDIGLFLFNDLLRILFLTGLAVAGVSDWKYYRIPNWVIVWEMALGCISLFFQAGRGKIGIWNVQWLWFLVAVAACVFRAVLLLIPGIVLSHFGLVGAGDMKLMAVLQSGLVLKNGKGLYCRTSFRSGSVSFKNAAGWKCLGAFSLFICLYQASVQ